MPVCFVVDKMLGKLSKWLRILGFDTVYLDNPSLPEIEAQTKEGRVFLTRNRKVLDKVEKGVFISADRVEDQLKELIKGGYISYAGGQWFSRCILCNEPLKSISREDVEGRVPEFIRHIAPSFSICPVCCKIYWPGSHLSRMRERILAFSENTD